MHLFLSDNKKLVLSLNMYLEVKHILFTSDDEFINLPLDFIFNNNDVSKSISCDKSKLYL